MANNKFEISTHPADPAANPGASGAAAGMAFQAPGTTVTVGVPREPRHYKFDPDEIPPATKPDQPYIPKKWLGKTYDSGSHKTYAQWSEAYGTAPVKIVPRFPGNTGGVTGLNGRCLEIGDTAELPVNIAMQLVQQGSAVFVLNSETAKDEKLIQELEAKGYHFAVANKPAREREEFQGVIKRRKWMAGMLEPSSPATA